MEIRTSEAKSSSNLSILTVSVVRILLITCAIAYLLIGWLFAHYVPEANEKLTHRLLVTGLVLVVLAYTYKSKGMNQLSIIVQALHVILTIDFIYLLHQSNLYYGHLVGLIIIVLISPVIYDSKRTYIFYYLFAQLLLLLSFYFNNASWQSKYIDFALLVLTFGLAFVLVKVRFELESKVKRAQLIVDNANNIILVFNVYGELTYSSPKTDQITGYDSNDISGLGWWDIYFKQHKDFFSGPDEVYNYFSGGNSIGREITKITKPNGELCYLQWSASLLENELLLIGADITSQKQTEKELKDLSYIASNINDFVVISGKNDNILWVNNAFNKLTGYSLEEVIGRSPREFLIGSDTDLEELRKIDKHIERKESFRAELINYKKNGEKFWLYCSTSIVLDAKGEISQFITVGNDITHKKANLNKIKRFSERLSIIHKIEKALLSSKSIDELANLLLNSLFQLFPDINQSGIYLFNSGVDSAYHVKYTADKGRTDRTANTIKLDENSLLKRIIEGDNVYYDQLNEQELTELGGSIKSYVCLPLLNYHTSIGALCIGSATTDNFEKEVIDELAEVALEFGLAIKQRNMQNTISKNNYELNARYKELESLNKELEQFAYIVSHDLKAPLRGIMSLAEFIKMDFGQQLGEEGKGQLNMLIDRAKKMSQMIDAILQYSRIQKKSAQRVNINLFDLLNKTIELVSPPSHLKVVVTNNLPMICADPMRIQQLFQNLITNAISAIGEGTGEINIGCDEVDGSLLFFIKDNGCGIEPEHSSVVFKMFETLGHKSSNGTGIGLSVVKKVVELYEGEVWIESEKGLGTTVFVKLPKKNITES